MLILECGGDHKVLHRSPRMRFFKSDDLILRITDVQSEREGKLLLAVATP